MSDSIPRTPRSISRVIPPVCRSKWKRKLKPLSSLLETKRLMKQGQAELVKKQMAEEGTIFSRMLKEPAALEAFGAFMEKRRPDFSKL